MTVKEFIDYLKTYPDDSLILMRIDEVEGSLSGVMGFEYLIPSDRYKGLVTIIGYSEFDKEDEQNGD